MRWIPAATGLNVLFLFFLLSCQSDKDLTPASDCLVRASSTNGVAIAGSYIVTYKSAQATMSATGARLLSTGEQLLSRHGLRDANLKVLFSGDKMGLLAHLSATEAERLKTDSTVETIEPDRVISLCSCVDVTASNSLTWNVRQTGYGRGDLNSDKTAWILDTGIDLDHPDLNVDVTRSQSFISGTTDDDENGHGTHIAGIIGAKNNDFGVTGVASGATLVSLRVLNSEGEGNLSTLIQAISHVSQNGKAGDVVNISIGGEGRSTSLERVIAQAANKGILFAVAAGNEGKSADGYAPANIDNPNVFTVSAMDQTNTFASFSNYGPTVDVCAYGVRVASTYKNGQYATLSGTSMASPHVAGLLLLRGRAIPTNGYVKADPDGQADPIAGSTVDL